LTLHSTPCWASTDPAADCGAGPFGGESYRYAPKDPGDYAEISAYIADRYEGRIAAIELWNEPDLEEFFTVGGTSSEEVARQRRASAYAGLVRAAYGPIKEGAPGVPVLAGAIEGSDVGFLKLLYDRGITGHYDAISFHPYNGPDSPTSDRPGQERQFVFRTGVPAMREVMAANGDPDGRVWLTELGWSTCTDGNFNCVSEGEQADYLANAMRMIRDSFEFVDGVSVYEIRDSDDGGCWQCDYGAIRRDFTPKPSFDVLRQQQARLELSTAPQRLFKGTASPL
jgi:hypothetical protein